MAKFAARAGHLTIIVQFADRKRASRRRNLTDQIDHAGVAAIPPSAFYSNPADGRTLVRFAFCKQLPTLEEAVGRMRAKLT